MTRIKVGDEFSSNYGTVRVVDYIDAKKLCVEFLNSGNKLWCRSDHLKNGRVKDPMQSFIYGVGYNCYDTKSRRCLNVWSDMIRRCYDPSSRNFHRYGGRGVCVIDQWKDYKKFENWFLKNYVEGCELDKDIMFPECKFYSPDTCFFIPKRLNSALGLSNKIRSKHGLGVTYFEKRTKPFCACIKENNKKRTIGYFHTKEEAFSVYSKEKKKFIEKLSSELFVEGLISKAVFYRMQCFKIEDYEYES